MFDSVSKSTVPEREPLGTGVEVVGFPIFSKFELESPGLAGVVKAPFAVWSELALSSGGGVITKFSDSGAITATPLLWGPGLSGVTFGGGELTELVLDPLLDVLVDIPVSLLEIL